MSTKRRPAPQPSQPAGFSRMNFRPTAATDSSKYEPPKGTKPTTTPATVKEIFTIMVLHVCKKTIFFDTNIKVAIYMGALFLISLIADTLPMPKSYMARSDNIFNSYFVKFAWAWNLLLLVPFVLLSSYVYCCGQKDKIAKTHIPRIVVATFCWFFWTKLFNVIEASYGKCNMRGFGSKSACLKSGNFWHGFDLSGHSFILIYGSLVLIEETRSIMNWESIREYLRNEDHYRVTRDTSVSTNPLRNLPQNQFQILKLSYEKFTPYIRALFIAITLLQILWDVMLVCTMLYYHIMIEKFLGGAIAILTWFVTYRFWYKIPNILPGLPAEGLFKYIKEKPTVLPPSSAARKRASSVANGSDIPMFMGRPLYTRAENSRTENITPDMSSDEVSTSAR